MVIVACVPRVDAALCDSLVVPAYIHFAYPLATSAVSAAGLARSPAVAMLLILAHSLCTMAAGLAGAAAAWKLGAGLDESDGLTTTTTGHP